VHTSAGIGVVAPVAIRLENSPVLHREGVYSFVAHQTAFRLMRTME
jgi:hypothetical protein